MSVWGNQGLTKRGYGLFQIPKLVLTGFVTLAHFVMKLVYIDSYSYCRFNLNFWLEWEIVHFSITLTRKFLTTLSSSFSYSRMISQRSGNSKRLFNDQLFLCWSRKSLTLRKVLRSNCECEENDRSNVNLHFEYGYICNQAWRRICARLVKDSCDGIEHSSDPFRQSRLSSPPSADVLKPWSDLTWTLL